MNESCTHLPEAETTLPIVAMPRDGSIPHIPMFMVTKAAPNSFDHAGCTHLQDPLSAGDAATICYYKGCFGQKAYKYTPIHASYSPAANEINCEVQGEALLQRLERESIRIKMQWQAVTCLSEMSHSLVKH